MLKAVIYDMDGVLTDTEPLHKRANEIFLREQGIPFLDEYYEQFIGSTYSYMWERYKEDYGLSCSFAELKQGTDRINQEIIAKEGQPEIPYAKEGLEQLHKAGFQLAVASSSHIDGIRDVVRNLRIDTCFDELVSGEDVEHPKPAPDVFLKAAQLLGVLPSECLVIEDSENGCKAAKAAGMVCIGFLNQSSGKQDLSAADYVITSQETITPDFVRMVYAHARGEA